jgi:glycosyltransferase involved in cell wall biosynthesis
MRVGVFFPSVEPDSGGGYTFEQEILRALLEVSTESHHELSLYFIRKSGQSKEPLPSAKNMKAQWLKFPKKIPPSQIFVSEIAKKMGWDKPVITPQAPLLQTAGEHDRIQLMWFVTTIYFPVEIPYIATMWDIQHRLQPWFPEFSHKGIGGWDYRENYYANFLQRATYIIVPNQAGQNELELFYQIPPERFRRLPHPTPRIESIPSENDIALARKKYNLSKRYLFYPAQFWAHKNHVNLLRALNILHEKYKIDLDLVLTGSDQGNLEYVQSVIEELHLKGNTHILGFIPREDLLALYAGAFALAYVSYFGPENLPPLEAFACGCPVVASNVHGSEEQFGDAVLRASPSSPDEIASAVKKIHDDPALRNDLIAKGLVRARKFTSQDYVRAVFAMLDDFEAVRVNWK